MPGFVGTGRKPPGNAGEFPGKMFRFFSAAVCAGFWARHRDDFTAGQMAQRFGLVRFVEHNK